MKKKLFIGTLFSGEGDFDMCVDALKKQSDVDLTHYVIEDMPEREAHDKLYNTWLSVKHDFDMFVKVDADTVLAHSDVLRDVCSVFDANKNVTSVRSPLYDFFTDKIIHGMNTFSPRVLFKEAPELFCDRTDIGNDLIVTETKLAGYHCKHSTEIQSFRYGLHRSLKNQTDTIKSVLDVFYKTRDKRRGLVLLGATIAFEMKQHNYTDVEFKDCFDRTLLHYDELIQKFCDGTILKDLKNYI